MIRIVKSFSFGRLTLTWLRYEASSVWRVSRGYGNLALHMGRSTLSMQWRVFEL